MKSGTLVILFGFVLISSAQAAMLVDNYAAATNARFENSDSPDQFFLSAFDLSGVGQDSNGRWATLIGPNTIISAHHFRPSGVIRFYDGNNAGATPVELTITTDATRIAGSDLWIARLSAHAPSSLAIYDYATQAINPPGNNDPYQGDTVYMTGRTPSGFTITQSQAFGENIVSGFVENATISSLNSTNVDALAFQYDPGDTTYESFYRSGDSGAPLFTPDGNGGLLLLGVASFVTTDSQTNDPIASFASYTGDDSNLIDSQVATWAAVPEPGSFLLLVAAALLLAAVHLPRRRC